MDPNIISICTICRYRIGDLTSHDDATFVPTGERWSLCPMCFHLASAFVDPSGALDRERLGRAVRRADCECSDIPEAVAGMEAPWGSAAHDRAVTTFIEHIEVAFDADDIATMSVHADGVHVGRQGSIATCLICQRAYGTACYRSDLSAIPESESWVLCDKCLATLRRFSKLHASFDWLHVARAHDAARRTVELHTENDLKRIKALKARLERKMQTRGETLSRQVLNDVFYASELVVNYNIIASATKVSPMVREVVDADRDAVYLATWRAMLN